MHQILQSSQSLIKKKQITQVLLDDIFNQVITILGSLKINFLCIQLLRFICKICFQIKNIEQCLKYVKCLAFIADLFEDYDSVIWAFNKKGLCYRMLRFNIKSLNAFKKMLQFSIILRRASEEIKALDNIGIQYYYLNDIAKASKYHKMAMLGDKMSENELWNVMKKRFLDDKYRRNILLHRKTPMFKLDLIETILQDYNLWSKDQTYKDYQVNLGVFEEVFILGKERNSESVIEKIPNQSTKASVGGESLYEKVQKKQSFEKIISVNNLSTSQKYLSPQILKIKKRCRRAPVYSANFTKEGHLQTIKISNPFKHEMVCKGMFQLESIQNMSLLTSDMTKNTLVDLEQINQERKRRVTSLYTPNSTFEEALCGGLGNSFIAHYSQNKRSDLFLESSLVSSRVGNDSVVNYDDAFSSGQNKKDKAKNEKTVFDLKHVMVDQESQKEICFDYVDFDMRNKLVIDIDSQLQVLRFYIGYLLNLINYS